MAENKYNLIAFGNGKLKKNGIAYISMPPKITCPGMGECGNFCYGCPLTMIYPSYGIKQLANLDFFLHDSKEFERVITAEINASNRMIFRWMDVGDIINRGFLEVMVNVANSLKHIQFYAYTKSLPTIIEFGWDNLPCNLKIIQSYGGKYDHLIDESRPFAKIFASAEEIPKDFTNATDSDYFAATIATKIGIVAHGMHKKKAIKFIKGDTKHGHKQTT
jgi:hypothetical protein